MRLVRFFKTDKHRRRAVVLGLATMSGWIVLLASAAVCCSLG